MYNNSVKNNVVIADDIDVADFPKNVVGLDNQKCGNT